MRSFQDAISDMPHKDQVIAAVEASLADFASFPQLRSGLDAINMYGKLHLLAIGKSAAPMASVAVETLRTKGITFDGYLLTKYGYAISPIPGLITLEAGHPLPDANSLKHSATILAWLQQLPARDTLVVLLSGGGSALFEVPEDGCTLCDIIELNRKLLGTGLDIAAMNEARRKLSKVKGGKALEYVSCGQIHVFALSDVAGNDPQVIASGPFTPSSDTDKHVSYHIIGDNYSLRQLVARKLPFSATAIDEYLACSATKACTYLAEFAFADVKPGTFLFGGEAPVKTTGNGRGGRCTHLALDFAIRIANKPGISLLCYASDGCDNLEGVAGAYVTGKSFAQMQSRGLNPESYLRNCDSFTALQAIGAVVPSCAARINVNDIYILSRC